jgi:hypothetical protein
VLDPAVDLDRDHILGPPDIEMIRVEQGRARRLLSVQAGITQAACTESR